MRALGEAPVCNISKLRPAACHSESLTEHIAILHISKSEYCNITYQYIAMSHISKLPYDISAYCNIIYQQGAILTEHIAILRQLFYPDNFIAL